MFCVLKKGVDVLENRVRVMADGAWERRVDQVRVV